MHFTSEALESFKNELTSRRDRLKVELAKATEEWINDESIYADSVDQASAETERSIDVQMKNRDRDILVTLNQAIRRIELGNFGTCEKCDDQISEARMRANPATTLCIDCKAELESEERSFSRRA